MTLAGVTSVSTGGGAPTLTASLNKEVHYLDTIRRYSHSMKTGESNTFLSSTFERPVGTVADYVADLQANNLFSRGMRGRYGGADLTDTDIINGMLAIAIDHPRGDTPSESVKRARALKLDKEPTVLTPGFTKGLKCFHSATAGEALDNLIFDLRNWHFALWSHGDPWALTVSLDSKGEDLYITLSKTERQEHAAQTFTSPAFASRQHLVDRRVVIDGKVFEHFAKAIGHTDAYQVPKRKREMKRPRLLE